MLETSDHLSITWDSGVKSKFHWIWLRDSCLCDSCMNSNAKQKYNDVATLSLDIKPESINQDSEYVYITWEDRHISQYSKQWLIENDYSNFECESSDQQQFKWKPWKSFSDIENAKFHISNTETGNDYHSIIQYLLQYGFVLLKNDKSNPATFEEICQSMAGFTDRSYFGEYFDLEVKSEDTTDSISFSTKPLPLHTDIPYYTTTPDYQFLYGLEVSGNANNDLIGKTLFVDGLAVANRFKDIAPEDYKTLISTKVTYRAAYPQANKIYRNMTEIIKINESGEVVQLLNNPSKMFFENIPYKLMRPLYKAYRNFKRCLHNDSISYSHTWEQGDMIVFDNRRIFHEREGFHDPHITRKLRGGYMREVELTARYAYLDSHHKFN